MESKGQEAPEWVVCFILLYTHSVSPYYSYDKIIWIGYPASSPLSLKQILYMSLEVSHLLKIYGTQRAVNDVSFRIGKGEIVGFLGPNGAGKSTTMKMITGYLQPDGGKAVVSGIKVTDDPIAAKKKIGYLPEANPLYYDMYIKEYLDFIAGIHAVPNRK